MSSTNLLEDGPVPSAAAARPWSLAVRLTLWFFVASFALILAATGHLYLVLAANLDKEDDHFLIDRASALLALWRDPEALRQQVERAGATRPDTPMYLRVLGPDGRVIAESPGMAAVLPSAAFPDAAAGADDAMQGEEHRGGDGRWFRLLAVRDPSGPCLIQAALDRSNEEELLEDYRRSLWIVLGVSLILCSLSSYAIVRRAIRPVHDMAATAARIRSSTLDKRIGSAGLPSELRTLADSFNEMLDRLASSFERLSQFSADIAHELRTPLNILRVEAEVALSRTRTALEYQEVLASALEEYGKLAHMIDNLLFLARAENPATQIEREAVDVAADLERLREYYQETAAEAGVRLIVAASRPIMAQLDRKLLQRALGNLVQNAIAHTPPGGVVTLMPAREDGWLTIEVADTGTGIEAAHLPHLCDRFYKVDQARSTTKAGSSGLGLAIVKSIAALHGGTVDITSNVGIGTKVTLRLPLRGKDSKGPC